MARTGHSQPSVMQKMKVFFKYSSDGKNLNDKDLKTWFKENASIQATNSLFSGTGSEADLDALFRTFDIDGNGFVDFEEFCFISYLLEEGGSEEEKMKMIFRMFDADRNGYLTKDEVFLAWSRLGIYDFKGVEELFTRCDKNKDNKITINEWVTEMLSSRETRALVDEDTRKQLREENFKKTLPESCYAIKTLTGRVVIVGDLESKNTIFDIKEKIFQQDGIPPAQQRLLHDGAELKNGLTIGEYNIPFKSTIHMLLKVV